MLKIIEEKQAKPSWLFIIHDSVVYQGIKAARRIWPKQPKCVAHALVRAVSTLVSRPGVWTFRAWGRLVTGDGLSSRLQAGRQPAAGVPTGPTVQEDRRRDVG